MKMPACIEQIPLFTGLPPQHLAALCAGMREREFAAEQWIVREGEPGTSLFIVADGAVSVMKTCGGGVLELLDLLQSGDFFGEMSLFLSAPRSASVQAVLPTVCYELTFAQFDAVTQQHPEAALCMYRHCIAALAERLRESAQRLEDRQTRTQLHITAPGAATTPGLTLEQYAHLAAIQGAGELLATGELTTPEQARCRTVLREQLGALQTTLSAGQTQAL